MVKATHSDPLEGLINEAYLRWGIVIDPRKRQMLDGRLDVAIREAGVKSLKQLLDALRADSAGAVEAILFDALSTNFTAFFREREHIDFLVDEARRRSLTRARYWSAGCSNGSEPYSLAIALTDSLRGRGAVDLKILASDLALPELRTARSAVYPTSAVRGLPIDVQARHFEPVGPERVRVRAATRDLVTVARINLAGAWRLQGPFDAILCRNVMIYFSEEGRRKLVERYARLLCLGGHLIVGLTESISGRSAALQLVRPGVYQRIDAPA